MRKSHSAEYQQFQEDSILKPAKGRALPKGQQSLPQMFAKETLYSKTDPQQVKKTESYVENLVIKNMLPIYLCETEGFRDFIKDVDAKWRPCSGKWVSGVKIPQKYATGEEKLKSLFANIHDLSATIDIWSDRRMRGFMGITVHWMDKHTFEMHMACLAVIRIKGSHTGLNILEHFDNVMLKFNIKCKAVRIVSDGAANMRKAFELQLEVPADESEVVDVEEQGEIGAATQDCIDSDEEMEDAAGSGVPDTESSLDSATLLEIEQLEEELSAKVAAMFLSCDHYKRVGCFNHVFIMLLEMG